MLLRNILVHFYVLRTIYTFLVWYVFAFFGASPFPLALRPPKSYSIFLRRPTHFWNKSLKASDKDEKQQRLLEPSHPCYPYNSTHHNSHSSTHHTIHRYLDKVLPTSSFTNLIIVSSHDSNEKNGNRIVFSDLVGFVRGNSPYKKVMGRILCWNLFPYLFPIAASDVKWARFWHHTKYPTTSNSQIATR